MSQVNMQQVKELRERTQAGLNDCRSALVEAEGDMEKAVEIILKKGLAKSAKRAGAVASEGVVLTQIDAAGLNGTIVEVNIQTDFAAKNEDFLAFAGKVLEIATKAKPGADLSAEAFPGGGTVEDARKALVGKLGENIVVRRWDRVRLEGMGRVHSYVHAGNKIGVLIAAKVGSQAVLESADFAKLHDDVAMQVAAMAPQYLSRSDVPEEAKQKQTEIYDAQLVAENKPEKARPNIIKGKLDKWMKEICLLEQQSVIDGDKTVDQVRADVAKTLSTEIEFVRFVRYERGEGIERPQGPDFASEVAKMAGG